MVAFLSAQSVLGCISLFHYLDCAWLGTLGNLGSYKEMFYPSLLNTPRHTFLAGHPTIMHAQSPITGGQTYLVTLCYLISTFVCLSLSPPGLCPQCTSTRPLLKDCPWISVFVQSWKCTWSLHSVGHVCSPDECSRLYNYTPGRGPHTFTVLLLWENSAHFVKLQPVVTIQLFSFHQVPITAGWTEAAWNEKPA